MRNVVVIFIVIAAGLLLAFLPVPEGLSRDSWIYFSVFASVFITLIVEPYPPAFLGLAGVIIACLLKIGPQPPSSGELSSEQVLLWGLSGFSNSTVWFIFIAFMLALGYEKTGLGRRIALVLVKRMGKKTLGLGYSIALTDLILSLLIPSNTARSGGIIFPIVKNIPALYDSSPDKDPRKIGSFISWVAIASTCVTSSMFFTAMAPNMLALTLVESTGVSSPSWFEWFFNFLPVGILLLLLVPLLTYYFYPPSVKRSENISEWAGNELKILGRMSKKEVMMAIFAFVALTLWITGKSLDISPTISAIFVLCLMVLFKVITWDDILMNKAAWNVFLWFGSLVTLAGGLNNVGFLEWFASAFTSKISIFSPAIILISLVLVFYFIHYLFASSTAHVTALMTIFLVTGRGIIGINYTLLVYLLLYTLGIMGILTPYGTGPSPIWYGLKYIPSKTFWLLGALFGILFITLLLAVGIPWINLWN